MIVGNKTDLVQDDSERAVKSQDGKKLAEVHEQLPVVCRLTAVLVRLTFRHTTILPRKLRVDYVEFLKVVIETLKVVVVKKILPLDQSNGTSGLSVFLSQRNPLLFKSRLDFDSKKFLRYLRFNTFLQVGRGFWTWAECQLTNIMTICQFGR